MEEEAVAIENIRESRNKSFFYKNDNFNLSMIGEPGGGGGVIR